MRQAAREEEAANRASMPGRDAFEELKRMAAATISATPPGLRGAAPSGNGKDEEAGTSGNGRHLLLAPGSWHKTGGGKAPHTKCDAGTSPVAAMLPGLHGIVLPWKLDGGASAVAPIWACAIPNALHAAQQPGWGVRAAGMPGCSGICMVHELHPCGILCITVYFVIYMNVHYENDYARNALGGAQRCFCASGLQTCTCSLL